MTNTTHELSIGNDGQASKLMGAELMFYDDSDAMHRATPALVAHGFEVRPFDWRDPCGTDTRWCLAWMQTTLDESKFDQFVTGIVEPFGGEILESGAVDSADELAAWQARDGCCGG